MTFDDPKFTISYVRVPAPVIALVFELVTEHEETPKVVPVPIEIAEAVPDCKNELATKLLAPVPAVVIQVVFIASAF